VKGLKPIKRKSVRKFSGWSPLEKYPAADHAWMGKKWNEVA
jgi:hypothetical protein